MPVCSAGRARRKKAPACQGPVRAASSRSGCARSAAATTGHETQNAQTGQHHGAGAVQQAKPAECEANCAHHRPVRLSGAQLLKRVFDLGLEHGPNCGGELKIMAAILEHCSCLARSRATGPARRAAGVGCVRVVAGPMKAAWRKTVTRGWRSERRFRLRCQRSTSLRLHPTTNSSASGALLLPRTAAYCRVRGAMGTEKKRLKILLSSSLLTCVIACNMRTP